MEAANNISQPTPAPDGEVLVRVNGVSKKFCRDLKKSLWYGLKDVASELLPFGQKEAGGRQQSPEFAGSSASLTPAPNLRQGEFWANKDISFELRRGECLGLIGRNGAGKTTLLKMLNGLIKPDAGSIEMRGRVGALIALGAGFNPILTGRENIYVNASILGLAKKEIDEKIDEIIEFAEIRDFIDAPVQSYSSGMQVRLGFAVATALEPDVLILDEVLAVGDAAFRMKCYNRIGGLQKNAAIIFVTHAMEHVAQICDRVMVLNRGANSFLGDVSRGVALYDSLNASGGEDLGFERWADPVEEGDIRLSEEAVAFGLPFNLCIRLRCSSALCKAVLRIQFYNEQGAVVSEFIANEDKDLLDLLPGENVLEVELAPLNLKRGNYQLSVLVYNNGKSIVHFWSYKRHGVQMDSPPMCSAPHMSTARKVAVRHSRNVETPADSVH